VVFRLILTLFQMRGVELGLGRMSSFKELELEIALVLWGPACLSRVSRLFWPQKLESHSATNGGAKTGEEVLTK
jgi:hypothetical protein